MSYTLYKVVDFGPGKASLATVGYKLTGGSRITAGVAEIGTATGVYGATVTFSDGFSGSILWDTGEGSPVYTAEDINPSTLIDGAITEAKITLPTETTGTPSTALQLLMWIAGMLGWRKVVKSSTEITQFMANSTTIKTTSTYTSDDDTDTLNKAS